MESGQQESDTQEGLVVFRLWSVRTKKGRDQLVATDPRTEIMPISL